ncbi:MAG: CUB domain-containing protein [Bacteroidota bacterium]
MQVFQFLFSSCFFRISLLLSVGCLTLVSGFSQSVGGKYSNHFKEAYDTYPVVPKGLLEAVAYTNTRVNHVRPDPAESCQDMPLYYGVMGLVEDGKGYFQNSLQKVAALSGYDIQKIKDEPRINILAYASAYASLQANKRMTTRSVDAHEPILEELSEIPQDGTSHNQFALDQQFYGVLTEMQTPHTATPFRTRRLFNYEEIFGKETYRLLSADRLSLKTSTRNIAPADGSNHRTQCTSSNSTPDFSGALWSPANSRNFGSRNGEEVKYVTIHTIQGSYASAISWFKNRHARVSAHYIIRSSDGQITQMVCENDKGFHVKTDNANAIGIEHEGFIDDGAAWYTNEMYESSAALVRDICERHGIDPLKTFGGPPTDGIRTLSNTCYHVKGHQHFRGNNHIDPGPFWDWDRFYRLVNPDPTPTIVTDRKGEFTDSGGATGNYGDQERTTYLIQPANVSSITVVFKEFELEGTEDKPYDYLDIYDGSDANGEYLGRFTGNQLPGDIIAKSGAVFMEFRSDCQINKKGWKISYSSRKKNPECANPGRLLAGGIFPMGATLSWDDTGADRYRLLLRRKLEDKWASFPTQQTSTTITGLSANAEYQWQVQAICGQDSSALVGDRFVTPNLSRSGSVQVFSTRLNQGRFHDSGGTFAGYGNNENYLFRIIPPDGGKVEIRFSSFDVEEELDVLTIYDGLNMNGTKLGTFSGKDSPGTIISRSNALTLHFKSDNRTNGPGWKASWRSIGGTTQSGSDSPSGGGGGTTDPAPPIVTDNSFDPKIVYPNRIPTIEAELADSYESSFNLKFVDKDRSGRGIANRFYTVAQTSPNGYQANEQTGFFYEDFNQGLNSKWTSSSGSWQVVNGHLSQSNATAANSNLHTKLTQKKGATYLYHWKAKMTGEKSNRRHGIHFFASDLAKTNRGNSYFVWIRDGSTTDYVEIYKTVNDKFDRKIRRTTTIETGKVYDFKTIYNPDKGRIEVYVNDKFTVSWVDRYPLTQGKGISLRSGNCIATFDDVIVYKSRDRSERITVGPGANSFLPGKGGFLVQSLVIDKAIHWSKPGRFTSTIGGSSSSSSSSTGSGNTGGSNPQDESGNLKTGLQASYSGDFQLKFDVPDGGRQYYLVSDYNGNRWTANNRLGFLLDEFAGSQLSSEWGTPSGNWQIVGGALRQADEQAGNTNAYLPLTQVKGHTYLYHWRAKVLSEGNNRRFGLHFFSSKGNTSQRGDSYMVWFRYHENKPDKVEVYRFDDDSNPDILESAIVSLKRNQWHDCRVMYNPATAQVEVYLDRKKVLSWKDDRPPHQSGSFLSLRTGNSRVEFDDIRVYQLRESNPVSISVGDGEGDMIRFKSSGNQAAARVYSTRLSTGGRWTTVKREEARIE